MLSIISRGPAVVCLPGLFPSCLQLHRQPSLLIFPRGQLQAERTSTLEPDRNSSDLCFVMSLLYDSGPQFDCLSTELPTRAQVMTSHSIYYTQHFQEISEFSPLLEDGKGMF